MQSAGIRRAMRRAGRTAPGTAAAPATLICTGETTFSAGRYRRQIGGDAHKEVEA